MLTAVRCDTGSVSPQQASRLSSTLQFHPPSLKPSPALDQHNASLLLAPPAQPLDSRPCSRRLSVELDELLQWEGLARSDLSAKDNFFCQDDIVEVFDHINDPAPTSDDYDAALDEELGGTAGYSRLGDILASAKKKLEALEDNLKGARHSLTFTPVLPSSASTASLHSTTSSGTSPSFSAISDEDTASDCHNPRIMPSQTQLLDRVEHFTSSLDHGLGLSDASIPLSDGTIHTGHSLEQDLGQPSWDDDNPAMWSVVTHSRTSSANDTCPCTILNKPVAALRPGNSSQNITALPMNIAGLDISRQDSKVEKDSKAERSNLSSEDPHRLSTGSTQSTATARGPSTPLATAVPPRQAATKSYEVVKRPSFSSSVTESVTETDSLASGWDTDSDDSDSDELFEGTWPMPPASIGFKPALPATIQIISNSSSSSTKTASPTASSSSSASPSPSDDGSTTPRGSKATRNSMLPITALPRPPVIESRPSNSRPVPDTLPPRQGYRIIPPRSSLQPQPRSILKSQASAPALGLRALPLPTAVASKFQPQVNHQSQPQTQSQPSRPSQIDSKALNASDQALAFTLAESMHDACLRLRDSSDTEKGMWRDRIERARKVLSGAL